MSQSHLEPFPPLDGLKLWHLLQTQISGADALKVNFDGSDLLMHRNIHGGHHMPEINLYNEEQRMKMNHQQHPHHHLHSDKVPCSCPMCIPDKKNLNINAHSHQILHQPNQHHHVLKQPSHYQPSSTASITINCSMCHKKIKNPKKQTAQNNHGTLCEKCSRSQKNLYNHNNIHSNNAQNQQQNLVYSHNSHDYGQFSSHTVNDSHLSAHPCKVCKRGFLFKHDLDRHTKASRGECGKQFKCEKCYKFFSNGGNLKRHHLIHTGEKPYSCMVCNKAFRSKTLLENHVRTHTGEKPFECHQCSKRFAKGENLRRHLKIHVKTVVRD